MAFSKFVTGLFILQLTVSVVSTASEHRHTDNLTTCVFDRNEELTYSVSWMSITIGTITMKLVRSAENEGLYSASAYIDSRNGLPFADVHAVFKGMMNEYSQPQYFIGFDRSGSERWSVLRYDYHVERNLAFVKKGNAVSPEVLQLNLIASDTLRIDQWTQDGLSVFYFGRQQLRSLDTFTVKTIVQGNVGTTVLNCYDKRTEIDIDSVNYPVDVLEMDGTAKFKGVFGLSGGFKGWFSNDNAHVPIRATLGVILGNVTLELIRWKREGWSPPRLNKSLNEK